MEAQRLVCQSTPGTRAGLVPAKPTATAAEAPAAEAPVPGAHAPPPEKPPQAEATPAVVTTRGSLLTATDPAQPKIKHIIEKRMAE